MFGVILKATNGSFQKDMTFCRSIYVKRKLWSYLHLYLNSPRIKSACLIKGGWLSNAQNKLL